MLIISDVMSHDCPSAAALVNVMEDLNESDIDVMYESDPESIFGCTRIMSAGMDAVVIDWNMPNSDRMVSEIRDMDGEISIFLMTVPEALGNISLETVSKVDEFLWVEGDSPSFMAGNMPIP